MSKLVLMIVLFAVLLGCDKGGTRIQSITSPSQNNTPSTDRVEEEEFAVYNLVVNTRYILDDNQLVVIREETSLGTNAKDPLEERLQFVHEKLPQIDQTLQDDFFAKNKGTSKHQDRFTFRVKHTTASKAVLESLSQGPDFWREFYKKFPGATEIVSLSRVGFNKDFNRALVYIATSSGPYFGTGSYFLLSRKQNGWAITSEIQAWAV